jgi:hypothetical protein
MPTDWIPNDIARKNGVPETQVPHKAGTDRENEEGRQMWQDFQNDRS